MKMTPLNSTSHAAGLCEQPLHRLRPFPAGLCYSYSYFSVGSIPSGSSIIRARDTDISSAVLQNISQLHPRHPYSVECLSPPLGSHLPVSSRRLPSNPFPIHHHPHQRHRHPQTHKPARDEHLRQSVRLHPRRDRERDADAKRVPQEGNPRECIAGDLSS